MSMLMVWSTYGTRFTMMDDGRGSKKKLPANIESKVKYIQHLDHRLNSFELNSIPNNTIISLYKKQR